MPSEEDQAIEARFISSFEKEKEKESAIENQRIGVAEQKRKYDLSCGLKFDAFLDCNSPRGQLYNLYRHGEPLPCSEQIDDLMFCLKVKLKSQEEAQALYEERMKEKAAKAIPVIPVWTMRTEPPPNFPPKVKDDDED